MLGVHWIADAVGCRGDTLTAQSVRQALVDLPERLELTRVGEPQVFEHDGAGHATSIAGIVLIAESHVSIHCFPNEAAVHVDVFSCKAMDLEQARSYVRGHFGARHLDESLLDRGSNSGISDSTARVRRAR